MPKSAFDKRGTLGDKKKKNNMPYFCSSDFYFALAFSEKSALVEKICIRLV